MKKSDGYMTLEATLVMPIVLGIVFLIMYMWLFSYDKALMTAETSLIMIKAGDDCRTAKDVAILAAETYSDMYLAWNQNPAKITMHAGKFIIEKQGSCDFPFGSLISEKVPKSMDASIKLETRKINATQYLRTIKTGEKDDTDRIY